MMKKALFTILLLIGLLNLHAQELPLHQYYLLNPYLMNPALAGISPQTEIRATLSRQWVGLANSPSTQTLSAHSYLGKGMGMGGYFFNDKNGLNRETGINLSGSYQVDLGENDEYLTIRKLCFGLGVSGFQHTVNLAEFTDHDYDPAVDGADKSAIALDFNLGTYLRYDGIIAGFSAAGLGLRKLKIYDDATEPDFPVHFFLNLGYVFSPLKDFIIEPSLVYKFSADNTRQIDLNLKTILKRSDNEQYWLSLSVRRNGDKGNSQFLDFIVLAGLNYGSFLFAYAYDFGLSEIRSSNSGSHQLMFGGIIKQAKKHRISCPIY